jgi:hypothetical protein
VLAAEGVHEHDGVEPDEGDGGRGRASEPPRRLPHGRQETERRQRREQLVRPVGERERQLGGRQQQQREQRAVRAAQAMPVAVRVDARSVQRARHMHVRIQVMHDVESRVCEVVEKVREPDRRRQQEDRVQCQDGADHGRGPHGATAEHDDQPSGEHAEQRHAEVAMQHGLVAGERWEHPAQRTREPRRERSAVRRRQQRAAFGRSQHNGGPEQNLRDRRALGKRAAGEPHGGRRPRSPGAGDRGRRHPTLPLRQSL